MNCLITGGRKKWILIDTRKYGGIVPWVRGGRYNTTDDLQNSGTDWVAVDVDSVDLNIHRYWSEIEVTEFYQEPGDCVFLPFSMLHYAEHLHKDKMQIAAMYMWSPEDRLDYSCPLLDRADLPALPLGVFDHVWFFSGRGVIPQGYQDPLVVLEAIHDPERSGGFYVQRFLRLLDGPVEGHAKRTADLLALVKVVEELVSGGSRNINLDLILLVAVAVDMDGLLCNVGEDYILRDLREKDKMLTYLRNYNVTN